MKKLKVCWISNIPSPYKTAVMNLLGEKCELAALYEKQAESDRETAWYDRSFRNYTGLYLNRQNFRRIIQDMAASCDCLINSDYSNPYAIYAAEQFRKRKKRVFLQADGGLAVPRGPLDLVISMVMKRCSGYISPGSETDRYFAYYNIDTDKIDHYRFSCMSREEMQKADDMRKRKDEFREKNGIREPYMILSVGQQIPRKGYDILAEALNGIGRDCGVYIIGGEPEEHVLAYVKEHQLDSVHFIPFMEKEKLMEYYAAADLFVLPTRYDIWGLVINEAMAYGLPVISTDRCVAAVEFRNLYDNALIVPAENADELRKAIMTLMDDPHLAAQLGERSINGIQGYTLENMRDDLISILEKHVNQV
ncbi:MAG: glycosyltransferase family 4 protein [Solobacterium sp.]|nr:glycosyltransferase family 4 protein [Solobacterium sp.]